MVSRPCAFHFVMPFRRGESPFGGRRGEFSMVVTAQGHALMVIYGRGSVATQPTRANLFPDLRGFPWACGVLSGFGRPVASRPFSEARQGFGRFWGPMGSGWADGRARGRADGLVVMGCDDDCGDSSARVVSLSVKSCCRSRDRMGCPLAAFPRSGCWRVRQGCWRGSGGVRAGRWRGLRGRGCSGAGDGLWRVDRDDADEARGALLRP